MWHRRWVLPVLVACNITLLGWTTSDKQIGPESAPDSQESAFVFLMNYVEPEDFAKIASWGINVVLVDLEASESDWVRHYESAIRHHLQLIPLIWGDDQALWTWNEKAGEWELSVERYPNSIGAQFLNFLRSNPRYLKQTYALYGFHEPLADPQQTGCDRLKKFYRQITREEFPEGTLRVYNEDFSMGWDGSDQCLDEITHYESHNIYPFAKNKAEIYRPFNPESQEYDPPTNDLNATLRGEIDTLDKRLSRWANADLPPTARRPRVVVILQAFAAEGERDRWNLWNRMPTASEIQQFAQHVLEQRGDQIAGFAWYPYEPVAEEYRQVLKTNRYDEQGGDRWEVIRKICAEYFLKLQSR